MVYEVVVFLGAYLADGTRGIFVRYFPSAPASRVLDGKRSTFPPIM